MIGTAAAAAAALNTFKLIKIFFVYIHKPSSEMEKEIDDFFPSFLSLSHSLFFSLIFIDNNDERELLSKIKALRYG